VATVIAVIAIVVALISAGFAKRAANANRSQDLQGRTPRLRIFLDNPAPPPLDRVIYRIRNDGPQDLESVRIFRPRTSDGIRYELAVTGANLGWATDEIELGPLAVTSEARFTLSCGAAIEPPEFVVRIHCSAPRGRWGVGPKDTWTLGTPLPPSRGGVGPVPPAEVRPGVEQIQKLFQEIVSGGGELNSFFLDDSRKHVGEQVAGLAERVGDWRLKEQLREIANRWNRAFAHSPPGPGARAWNLGAPFPKEYEQQDAEIDRRRGLVAEEAQAGLEACKAATACLNEIEKEAN